MTKYEAYNTTTTVQFIHEQEAIDFANANNMQVREIIVQESPTIKIPNTADWLNLEQELYSSPLLLKAVQTTGNGFAMLIKVLTDGKTTGASENALLFAFNLIIPQMNMTVEEIELLNECLEENNFNIRWN